MMCSREEYGRVSCSEVLEQPFDILKKGQENHSYVCRDLIV